MRETCCCCCCCTGNFTLHFSHFRVCFRRHCNEEEGDVVETDVGAIPKSSFVALSPMLCISEYSQCNTYASQKKNNNNNTGSFETLVVAPRKFVI